MLMKKKGEEGPSSKYITRSAALKKLQLSLQAFRKLCILKGVYPRDPKKKRRGRDKTYFHKKDIAFLAADPLIETFRKMKSHNRKIKKAKAKKQPVRAKKLILTRPKIVLDHVIRERYPTFQDVLSDMDDALCMISLFSQHPSSGRVKPLVINRCARLRREWDAYLVKTNSLTKAFVSIKGYYYQAEVQGHTITWMVPHQFTQPHASDVDYRVMVTFLDLYIRMLGFTFYRLYQEQGWVYPPPCNEEMAEQGEGLAAMLDITPMSIDDNEPENAEQLEALEQEIEQEKANASSTVDQRVASLDLKKIVKNDAKAMNKATHKVNDSAEGPSGFAKLAIDRATQKETHMLTTAGNDRGQLFNNIVAFVEREVPRHSVELCLRAFGARVSWPGGPFDADDKAITHHFVDREMRPSDVRLGRFYLQPQWVFDSINSGAQLSTADYSADATLPPHLSPFVDDDREGYVPAYRERLNRLLARAHEHRAALEAAGAVALGTPLSLDEVVADEEAADSAVAKQKAVADAVANQDPDALEAQYARELAAEARGESFAEHTAREKRRREEMESSEEEEEEEESSEEEEEDSDSSSLPELPKKREKKRPKGAKPLYTEEEKLAAVMLPKKRRRLMHLIERSHDRKHAKIAALEDKRNKVEKANKSTHNTPRKAKKAKVKTPKSAPAKAKRLKTK